MKKEKIRAIVVKVVLALVAVFVVMAVVGYFIPVGNANPSSDNVFPSAFSLLDYDESRKPEIIKLDEVYPDRVVKESQYEGFVIDWVEGDQDIQLEVEVEQAGKYEIAVDYLSKQTTIKDIVIDVTVVYDASVTVSEKNIELPICETVYEILYEGKDPKEALDKLFMRSIKKEF